VVVNCAGPFVLYGEPMLRAAVETSTHYLDTTGEQLCAESHVLTDRVWLLDGERPGRAQRLRECGRLQ
jgi:saccharopine dehydrogenase-like NADP-dependent oxidoreductase